MEKSVTNPLIIKVGDIVKENPAARMIAERYTPMAPVGTYSGKITRIEEGDSSEFIIFGFDNKYLSGVSIHICDGSYWGAPLGSPPLFFLVTNEKSVMSSVDLKVANSKSGVINCVSCGKKLKQLWPGMKFCPSCEP